MMSFNFPMTWKLLDSLSSTMSNDRSGVTFQRILIYKSSAQVIILLSLSKPFEMFFLCQDGPGSGHASDFQCLSIHKFSTTLCFCFILTFQKCAELG